MLSITVRSGEGTRKDREGRCSLQAATIKQAYGEAPSEAVGTLFKVMGIHCTGEAGLIKTIKIQ